MLYDQEKNTNPCQNIWGNSPEVVQGNLDLGLVVKLMEMPLKFVQLSLKAKDRDIRCRILETQLLHVSTEIQNLAQLCNLLQSSVGWGGISVATAWQIMALDGSTSGAVVFLQSWKNIAMENYAAPTMCVCTLHTIIFWGFICLALS